MTRGFDTLVERSGATLTGPWRMPAQMLDAQTYDGHASIHDADIARTLGFEAAAIEGPTHFSQFDPLCHALWGDRWFAEGCISAHYRAPVFTGERVRASLVSEGDTFARIVAEKEGAGQILIGTVSVGADAQESALRARLKTLTSLEQPVILRDVRVGMRTSRVPVRMSARTAMGDLYPFSLADKLARITEPSPLYVSIVPFEMVSVLFHHVAKDHGFPTRGPCVDLFADQEIAILNGPVLVDRDYEVEREVVAITGSRKTESLWIESRLFVPATDRPIARMLLNLASLKASYGPYQAEFLELYGRDASIG